MYSISYPDSWMKTDFLVNKKGDTLIMKSVVDYFVTPSEFNKFLDSLKKHEIEAIVTEGSYSRPDEGKEFLEGVVQDTWDAMEQEEKIFQEYTWTTEHVDDMRKFAAISYQYGNHNILISNPITLVDTPEKHIVKSARVKGVSVYDTYYINKPWLYMVTYGEDQ